MSLNHSLSLRRLTIERSDMVAKLVLTAIVVLIVKNTILSFKPIFAWDMIPRFSVNEIIDNSLYTWDEYLNRPNFRALQSSFTLWMLFYKIQWIGILISYILLALSLYVLFKTVIRVIWRTNREHDSLSALLGTLPALFFILISDGYWYHSIVMSLALSVLTVYFVIKFIYIELKIRYIVIAFLLIMLNPMISYNYLTVISLLLLYALRKIINPRICKEDLFVVMTVIGFALWIIRVVVPSIAVTQYLEYELELRVARVPPSTALIPITRVSYFFNLQRFHDLIASNPMLVIFYVYPLAASLSVLLAITNKKLKNRELLLWFSILMVLSIFSVQGSGFYFIAEVLDRILGGNMHVYSVLILPLRKSVKWLLLLAVVYGVMISILASIILSQQKPRSRIVSILLLVIYAIVLCAPFTLYPFNNLFSGDLGGALNPTEIPSEYHLVKESIRDDGGVLFFPVLIERPILAIANRKITDEFMIYFFGKPSYEAGGFDSYPFSTKAVSIVYSGLIYKKTNSIGNLLSALNIKYIVLDHTVTYDIPKSRWSPRLFSRNEFKDLYEGLKVQEDLVHHALNHISLYVNRHNVSPIYIPNKIILSSADISTYYSLSKIVNLTNNVVLNVDSRFNPSKAHILLLPPGRSLPDVLVLLGKGVIVTTDEMVRYGKLDSYKLAYIGLSELSKYYRKYNNLGFPSYSFYPYGISEIGAGVTVTKQGICNGTCDIYARISGKAKLVVQLNDITKVLKIDAERFRTFYLGTINDSKISISIKLVEGSIVIDSLYVIDHSETENLKISKPIIYILEAESFSTIRNAEKIESVNASNGALVVMGSNGVLEEEIEIIAPGTYRIALSGSGTFRVSIGNNTFFLKAEPNMLTYSPPINLTRGMYKLRITPINVPNTLTNPSFEVIRGNSVVGWKLFNKKEYTLSFERGLQGNYSVCIVTTCYEGCSWGILSSNAIDVVPGTKYLVVVHVNMSNVNRTHVEAQFFDEEAKKWVDLHPYVLPKTSGDISWSEYRAIITIPENTSKMRIALIAGRVNDPSRGKAVTCFDDIQVIPLEIAPKLDVVFLYGGRSEDADKTVEELFGINDRKAQVISYKKHSPTLWEVEVEASKPFLLVFATSYDPLWEAEIYRNGKLIGTAGSIPVYSTINGFWINATGNLTIVIRYVPQDWFELGLKISALTFALCVFYLVWDWRKCRGDRWALWLERHVRSIPKYLRSVAMRSLS